MKLRQTKGVPFEVMGHARTPLSGHRDREFGTLYRVVRYELKAKPKVPRPRALKQDSQKLKAFQKKLP